MKIIELKLQKKKRIGQACFKVVLDDETESFLDIDTAANFKLHSGAEYSLSQWQEILNFDARRVCTRKALNLISIRPRSRHELQERLLRDGLSESSVEEALNTLEENKYLNDEDFALRFAKSKIQHKIIGERALYHELKKKGLSDAVIEQALSKVTKGRDEYAIARAAAVKKSKMLREGDPLKRQRKLIAFLAQRGFSAEVSYSVASQIVKSTPPDNDNGDG